MKKYAFSVVVGLLLITQAVKAVDCSSLVVKRNGAVRSYPVGLICQSLATEVSITYDSVQSTYIVSFLSGAIDWNGSNTTAYWIYYDSGSDSSIPLTITNSGSKSVGVYLAFENNYGQSLVDFTNVQVSLGTGSLIAGYVNGDITSISVGGECGIQATGGLSGTITCGSINSTGIKIDGTALGDITTVTGNCSGNIQLGSNYNHSITIGGTLSSIISTSGDLGGAITVGNMSGSIRANGSISSTINIGTVSSAGEISADYDNNGNGNITGSVTIDAMYGNIHGASLHTLDAEDCGDLNNINFMSGSKICGTSVGDCNGNGHADSCDLVYPDTNPFSEDCNNNDTPDECDVMGSFAYTGPAYSNAGSRPLRTPAIADFDNDGDMDVVATNYSGDTVVLFSNNGSGGFGTPSVFNPGMYRPAYVATGDFNSDGFMDFAVTTYGTSSTANNGGKVFVFGRRRVPPPYLQSVLGQVNGSMQRCRSSPLYSVLQGK